MKLLPWIASKANDEEIEFDSELGDRLKQVFVSFTDKNKLMTSPDFMALLAHYVRIKNAKETNSSLIITISERFTEVDVSFLGHFGFTFLFQENDNWLYLH